MDWGFGVGIICVIVSGINYIRRKYNDNDL